MVITPFQKEMDKERWIIINRFQKKYKTSKEKEEALKKMANKDNHIFISASDVKEIKVKKFALLNNKTKRIEINTVDGKSHKLYANIEEKDFPYHKDNFARFIEEYENK